MKVFLKALGCRLNEAELSSWAQEYIQQGYTITPNEQDADLIVFNSCSVTGQADKKSRQLLKRFHRNNPNAKVIATGCSTTLNQQRTADINGVSLIVENRKKDHLVSLSRKLLDIPVKVDHTKQTSHQLFSRGRERAFIKVQDGCRYRCTFCIVTLARGEEKSKAVDQVIEEIQQLHQQGIQEVVLSGVHLGGYGSDIASNLTTLVKSVLENTDIARVRLGSLEPWELDNSFFDLFSNPRLMPHLHLPLQSGSDSILRKMARRCKTHEFSQLIKQARQAHQDMSITTDIIVGFPGESKQLWQQSFDYIQQCHFSDMHIFSYSQREGTKAAGLAEQVPTELKKQRNQQLQELAQKQQAKFMQQQKGKKVAILWESKTEDMGNRKVQQWGYTPNYLRVYRTIGKNQLAVNEITIEQIKDFDSQNRCLII